MTERRIRAFVDRFEAEKAVLLVGDHEETLLVVPVDLLPEDAVEGSVLRISIEVDVSETNRVAEDVTSIIDRLTDAGNQ